MGTTYRTQLAGQVAGLRAQGMTQEEIAVVLGYSRSYVQALLTDPDGSKQEARRARYGRPCRVCGKLTTGCNGPRLAPEICADCLADETRQPCGTLAAYQRGCSCEPCRAANRAHMATLKGKKPPSHGTSGYRNYGCRCDKCRRAHSRQMFLLCDERKRYPSAIAARKKAA